MKKFIIKEWQDKYLNEKKEPHPMDLLKGKGLFNYENWKDITLKNSLDFENKYGIKPTIYEFNQLGANVISNQGAQKLLELNGITDFSSNVRGWKNRFHLQALNKILFVQLLCNY